MIGILLALKVNEWRDFRDKRQKERQIIELLIRDLKDDKSNLEVFEDRLHYQHEGVIKFLTSIEQESPRDSIVKYARQGLGIWNYRPTYPTYEGLRQSGSLDLISNPDIRNLIIQYHDELITYLDDVREGYKKDDQKAQEAFEPYFGFQYRNGRWEAIGTFQDKDLQSDDKAKNLLSQAGRKRQGLINRINGFFSPENQILTDTLSTYLSKMR